MAAPAPVAVGAPAPTGTYCATSYVVRRAHPDTHSVIIACSEEQPAASILVAREDKSHHPPLTSTRVRLEAPHESAARRVPQADAPVLRPGSQERRVARRVRCRQSYTHDLCWGCCGGRGHATLARCCCRSVRGGRAKRAGVLLPQERVKNKGATLFEQTKEAHRAVLAAAGQQRAAQGDPIDFTAPHRLRESTPPALGGPCRGPQSLGLVGQAPQLQLSVQPSTHEAATALADSNPCYRLLCLLRLQCRYLLKAGVSPAARWP